jgi:chemosensory pili system protein ChpA (sensor histidine kinase/response regulator)
MRALLSMQNLDTATAASALDVHANDLGPLAWVLDELRKSLDSATKALRRYVRDAELARGSDLAAVDSGQLRISRQQLHQAVGALDMVGFTGPAIVLRAMENAVQKFVNRPELCTEAAAVKIERASFALTGFLETVLSGKSQTPVALFVQYAEVQEIAGAARVHPADLWPYPWRWSAVSDTGAALMPLNADTRVQFDKAALQVIKTLDTASSHALANICAGIAQQPGDTPEGRQFSIFWRIAAGFFQALGSGSLAGDVYVKRTVSRILIQLAVHIKGDMTVSDRLAQDLLFFCAQAQPQGMAPLLGEVRMAYGLAAYPAIDYSRTLYGQFDPVLLVQARKRITSVKEAWSGLAAGDVGKVKAVQDQFSLIVDSITKLLPTGQALSKAFTHVADVAAKTSQAPQPALGMEVATAILYLEAGFEDFDPSDPAVTERVNHLAQRVENAQQGEQNQALEPWMEELYRRVSDRQTMGSVVGELKTSLAELEKAMDQFFRDPQDKTVLSNVPSRLAQMRGVLSVLGLDQASQAVLRMRDSVEEILVTEVDDVQARAAGTFDKLGNNLGALGFLIDMLSYQPALAKKLFVYDDERGELKPLMGRVNTPIPATEHPVVDASTTASISIPPAAAVVASVAAAGAAAAGAVAMTMAAPSPSAAAPSVSASSAQDTADDDAELLDIFLEEAREVVGNGQAAISVLAVEPGNLAELTTLRRAFHTIKGSSRMVGLNSLGEAGWSLEQMLNAWLADQKSADDDLRNTASQGLAGISQWVDAIAAGQDQAWTAQPFNASADSLRLHGKFLPLALGSVAPTDAAPIAAVAVVSGAAVAASNFDFDFAGFNAATPAAVSAAAPLQTPDEVVFDLPAQVATSNAASVDAIDMSMFDIDPSQPVNQTAVPEQSAADLDFAFDLAMSDLELHSAPVPAPPAGTVPSEIQALEEAIEQAAALPDITSAINTLAVDDGLSKVDLGDPAALDMPSIPDDVIFDLDIAAFDKIESAPTLPASESASAAEAQNLVDEDELAAFERAMLEQDALMAVPPEAMPAAPHNADAVDLDSANLGADHATPYSYTEVADFTASPTQPMYFADEKPPVTGPADLGFDLGTWGTAAAAGSAAAAGMSTVDTAYAAPVAKVSSVHVPNLPAQPTASSLGGLSADDQFKAIGPLRISLPLYNVYLNEADEWSRRLVTCLTEWSMEPGQPLPNDAVAFAHSLAGSSATVGFSSMSGLARSLENALQHMQNISEDGAYPSHDHAGEFVKAAEEIRRLLHQFAAGQLREASGSVQAGLDRCIRAPEANTQYHSMTAAASSGYVNLDDSSLATLENTAQAATDSIAVDIAPDFALPFASMPLASAFADLGGGASVTVIAAAGAAAVAAVVTAPAAAPHVSTLQVQAPVVAVPDPIVVASPPVVVPVVGPAAVVTATDTTDRSQFAPAGLVLGGAAVNNLSIVPRSLTVQETEDEIDVEDAIDPDLFPIFEEEALELFPQMSGALRQWTARPGNTGARSEVLRGLHTLKGSARLAGAMRLGELTHRMESAIEQTSADDTTIAQIEPLTALLDGMQANFDRLRHPQAEPEYAPVRPEPIAALPTASAAPIASWAAATMASSPATPSTSTSTSNVAAPATLAPVAALTPLRVVAPNTTALVAHAPRTTGNQSVRVRSDLLDRLVNQAGEVMITRSRLEAELGQLRGSLGDLTGNLDKLRMQLRDIEVQSESQMQSRMALAKETSAEFDPLEFDRFTRVQELTRMMAESVNDVATVQRSIQRTVESTEDDLVAQARQTRELQRDLLRTRMVEFEGISERLYRVVRQAGKDAGKQVKLDILGGSIEMDRGVLDRMTPAFEHLLRNCVAHGIESAEARTKAGKDGSGQITISLHQEGNDISVEFRDDGAGLNLGRIRERATAQGLLAHDKPLDDNEAANLIFTPGFTTATQVTELSGRGIGMDVVRSEVVALGGRIETSTSAGLGTSFKLVMPLTTAVTQVVMLRIGGLSIGVPANLVETVRRATPKELQAGYNTGTFDVAGEALPFFWSGALLQHSAASDQPQGKTIPVIVFRSAAQRIVAHVDEVLGNQEVVVKNLGPQLSRLPGMAGMSVLASGAVALIYNPVALAAVYGAQARAMSADKAESHILGDAVTDVVSRDLTGDATPVVPLVPANPKSVTAPQVPLVLVVDDSITVRRVTQRLLVREGYRVALAADGLQALERLAEEMPSVVLSDIEMPRMDGFDLVRNMKADPRWAKLPVITITSRIAEKHREHAMSLGVDHYLGKPYSEEELLSLVKRYTVAAEVIIT